MKLRRLREENGAEGIEFKIFLSLSRRYCCIIFLECTRANSF
jgi:hypothetical protein